MIHEINTSVSLPHVLTVQSEDPEMMNWNRGKSNAINFSSMAF